MKETEAEYNDVGGDGVMDMTVIDSKMLGRHRLG
jgi:hypothetical protein